MLELFATSKLRASLSGIFLVEERCRNPVLGVWSSLLLLGRHHRTASYVWWETSMCSLDTEHQIASEIAYHTAYRSVAAGQNCIVVSFCCCFGVWFLFPASSVASSDEWWLFICPPTSDVMLCVFFIAVTVSVYGNLHPQSHFRQTMPDLPATYTTGNRHPALSYDTA